MELGFSDRRESVNNSGYDMCATLVQMCVAAYELAFLMQSQVSQCTLVNKHIIYKWSLRVTSEDKFMSV